MSSKIKVDLLLHNVDIVVSSSLTFSVSYEMHCFEGLKNNNKLASPELYKMCCPRTSFSMQQIDENSFILQNDKIAFGVICFQRIFLSG